MAAVHDRVNLVGAWVVAHRGRPAAIALVVTAVAFGMFAHVQLQPWGPGEVLTLWAMAPGTLALVVATASTNLLGRVLACRPARIRRARAGWVALLLAAAGVGAVPIAVAVDDPATCWVTVLLAAATLGLAVIGPRSALVVGAITNAAAVLFGVQVRAARPLSTMLATWPGWVWPLLVLPCLAGVVVYVVRGPGESS